MVVELTPAGQEFFLTVLVVLWLIEGIASIVLGFMNVDRPARFGAGSVVWGIIALMIGLITILK